MRFEKRKVSGFSIIVVLLVMFTIIFVLFGTETPLQPYIEDESEISVSETDSSTAYATHTNEVPYFTVSVPSDWVRITQNGNATWVSKELNASFQVQSFSYTTSLSNLTSESITKDIEAIGGEPLSFEWLDQWTYAVSYRLRTAVHLEITAFNQTDAVRLNFVITEEHYEETYRIVCEIADSFVWDRFSDEPTHGD